MGSFSCPIFYCTVIFQRCITIQCIIRLSYKRYFNIYKIIIIFQEDTKNLAIHLKVIISAVFPFVLLSVNFIFWNMCKLKNQKRNLILTSFVIIDVIQPSIINTMIASVSCYLFEDQGYYLRSDMSYRCFTDDHFSKV